MGQIISSVGDRFYQFALLSIVLGVKGAQTEIGAGAAQVLFWAMVFTVLLAPWIGRIVDTHSRRTVMLVTDFGRAVLLLGLLFVWLMLGDQAREPSSRWIVLAFVSAIGLLNGIFIPARQASVSALVEKDELVRANALVTTVGVIASLLGATASVVLSLLGEVSVFFAAALGFIVSGLFILGIKNKLMPGEHDADHEKSLKSWMHGIHEALIYTWRHESARALVLLAGIGQFVLGLIVVFGLSHAMTSIDMQPATRSLAPLLSVFLGDQPPEERHVRLFATVGLLICSAVGLFSGVILCGKVWHVGHYNALPFWGLFLLGLSVFGFALAESLTLIFMVSLVLGLGGAMIATAIDARLQSEVRSDWLGRVFALRAAWMNTAFLLAMAMNLDGGLIQRFGADNLLKFVGFGAVFLSLVFMFTHPTWIRSLWHSKQPA